MKLRKRRSGQITIVDEAVDTGEEMVGGRLRFGNPNAVSQEEFAQPFSRRRQLSRSSGRCCAARRWTSYRRRRPRSVGISIPR